MRRLFARQYLDRWFLLVITLVLLLVFWIIEPSWLNKYTLQSLISQNAPLAVVAMAMTFSIISRHIDLSPGSMVGLVGAVIGLAFTSTHNIYLGMLAGLALALAVGIMTGLVVSRWGLSSIMVTLGTYIWARGLTIGANNGSPIVVGGGLAGVVNASWAGFTLTAPLLLVVYVGGWLLLTRTKMGRYTHAMGGDPTAARRSGVRVDLYTTLIFVLMAVMIWLATVVTVGQLGSAASSAGTGLELNAIVAVMIGGSRLAGGEGSVGRTALGVCFLSILSSGLLNLGLSQAYYQLLEGVALLAILSVQVWLRRIAGTGVKRGRQNVQRVAEPAIS